MGNLQQTTVHQITFKAAIDWYKQHAGEYGGVKNYEELTHKPSINGVQLTGDKTSEDLHIEGGTTIAGIQMSVVGTNVIFTPALDENYVKTTLVENTNIRFL